MCIIPSRCIVSCLTHLTKKVSVRHWLICVRMKILSPLRDSALARSRADWLMGMNLSRAYTLRVRRGGNPKVVLPVGRVKTPTLALVVRREREITSFTPEEYYLVKVRFAADGGEFVAKWKPQPDQVGLDSENRLRQKYIAEDLAQRLVAAPTAVIHAHSKRKNRNRRHWPCPCPRCRSWQGNATDMSQMRYWRRHSYYTNANGRHILVPTVSTCRRINGRTVR